MSAIDVDKDKVVKQVKERQEKLGKPLQQKDKRYFSKLRSAVKKIKKQNK